MNLRAKGLERGVGPIFVEGRTVLRSADDPDHAQNGMNAHEAKPTGMASQMIHAGICMAGVVCSDQRIFSMDSMPALIMMRQKTRHMRQAKTWMIFSSRCPTMLRRMDISRWASSFIA